MNYQAVIFDLDETVLNTRFLKPYRDRKDWNTCYTRACDSEFYPGIKELLAVLQDKEIPIGFVTNSPNKYAKTLLDIHRIPYDVIIAYFDTKKHKPDPEPMLLCADKLGAEPKKIIAIGDDVKDIIAANNAGMISVAVTWGNSSITELKNSEPRYMCNNEEELMKLF